MSRPSGPYLFILLTLLIDAIGIGIVFPIMPDLMAKVGAESVGMGALWAGLLMAAYAGAQFVFAPIIGSISDAFGRKPVLIAALAFLTLDYVIMALAETYWLLLAGRTLAGIAGATYVTATAYIADITPKTERAARFGMVGAAFGLGFVLGPALGGIAATWGVTAPFWVAAAISGANVVFGLLVLPESLSAAKRRAFGVRELKTLSRPLSGLSAFPASRSRCSPCSSSSSPTSSTRRLWAFWGREVFGWSTLVIGISLSVYGILVVVAQAAVMPVAVRHLGERRLTIWGPRRRRPRHGGAGAHLGGLDARGPDPSRCPLRPRSADTFGYRRKQRPGRPAGHGAGRAVVACGDCSGHGPARLHPCLRSLHGGRCAGLSPRRAVSARRGGSSRDSAARGPAAARAEELLSNKVNRLFGSPRFRRGGPAATSVVVHSSGWGALSCVSCRSYWRRPMAPGRENSP